MQSIVRGLAAVLSLELLGQVVPTLNDARLPIWVLGSAWLANQAVNTWLSARQRKIDQDNAGCLGELADCKEHMVRLEARKVALESENANLYVTVGQKDKQIEHHLAEKRVFLENNQALVQQVLTLNDQVVKLSNELREAQRHEARSNAERLGRLETKVEAQQAGPVRVEIDPTSEPVPVVVREESPHAP